MQIFGAASYFQATDWHVNDDTWGIFLNLFGTYPAHASITGAGLCLEVSQLKNPFCTVPVYEFPPCVSYIIYI